MFRVPVQRPIEVIGIQEERCIGRGDATAIPVHTGAQLGNPGEHRAAPGDKCAAEVIHESPLIESSGIIRQVYWMRRV